MQRDLLDHLGVQPIDGFARCCQVRRNAWRGRWIELPLGEARVFDGLGGIDLIGEYPPDAFGVNPLPFASVLTAANTCSTRGGSSIEPRVFHLLAATGSAVCSRCVAASTSSRSGLASSPRAEAVVGVTTTAVNAQSPTTLRRMPSRIAMDPSSA